MLEQVMLAQQIETLIQAQRQAAGTYASLASKAADPAVRTQLQQLCRDKEKHIALAQRILEIIE